MASTSLFAPQVRAVQPAFVYPGGVKIYFSLSAFNKIEEVKRIKYEISNPNQASTWGTNVICNGEVINNRLPEVEIEDFNIKNSSIEGEYYFSISLDEKIVVNQFYQIQIWLSNVDSGDQWSEPSQISLIRPIPNFVFKLDLPETNIYAEDLKILSGSVSLATGAQATAADSIGSYSIRIFETIEGKKEEVYSKLNIINTLGTKFSTKIDYFFNETGTYEIKIDYETTYGYQPDNSYSKEIVLSSIADRANPWETDNWKFTYLAPDLNNLKNGSRIDMENGAILFKFKLGANHESMGGSLIVQKASKETIDKAWITISEIYFKTDLEQETTFQIEDFFIDATGITYQYRVLFKNAEGEYTHATTGNYAFEADYEDIFLLDQKRQLAVRFNPNISNYKYITQESITNTLGGIYPIIRRNADTKYRQFSLSGTLYFDGDAIFSLEDKDSKITNNSMSQWFEDIVSSFFLTTEEAYYYADHVNWGINPSRKKIQLYEKKFKDAAINFLTNGKPKLFRSPTEGNMLIYLSNVSFTPNKTLGRKIYDFSATATEFAEYNYSNLLKYGIIASEDLSQEQAYIYVLEAQSAAYAMEATNIIVTPYVNVEKVVKIKEDSDNNYYLVLTAKAVKDVN